jgi:hypothetical protein
MAATGRCVREVNRSARPQLVLCNSGVGRPVGLHPFGIAGDSCISWKDSEIPGAVAGPVICRERWPQYDLLE